MYRPEGWENPYHKVWDEEFYDVHTAFEDGADAMLTTLKEDKNVLLHFNQGEDLAKLIPGE